MKAYRIIHIAANIAAVGLLGGFLVYFLLSYGGLPERIGVHFSPVNGQFDVFADKLFGFYPFVAGGVLIGIFSLLTLLTKKIKKLGLNITEQGDKVLRCAAALLLDLMKLIWAGFFSYWTVCVVKQVGMGDGTFLDVFRVFFILVLLATPILFSRIQDKYRAVPKGSRVSTEGAAAPLEKPKNFRVTHIIVNVVCLAALGVFLVWFIIAYSGLPERIGVHFASDGNFDVYMQKIFGLYPFVMGFGLFGIFSLANLGVNKIKRIGLRVDAKGELMIRCTVIETLDVLKMIWSAFFSVWAYCVTNQTPMNTTFTYALTLFFIAVFPVTAGRIIVTAKKHSIKDSGTQ